MPQIKITLTDEEINLLQARANKNLNSMSKEARVILHHALYSTSTPAPQPMEIAGIPFPAFPIPDYKITSTATSHTHSDITPPGVQLDASQTAQSAVSHASTIDIKPGIVPNPVKDYTQPTSEQKYRRVIDDTPATKPIDLPVEEKPVPHTPKSHAYKNNIQPTLTDLEIEQVDNEWDSEGNEYSTEDFMIDLKHLEDRLREGLPPEQDPTQDPDYITLKNYFIKHDLRERFRSLLSDPSRFYSEEGVYDPPQIKYARHAFRREKIDEDYIVSLLMGTGAMYRYTHKSRLYVDEQ